MKSKQVVTIKLNGAKVEVHGYYDKGTPGAGYPDDTSEFEVCEIYYKGVEVSELLYPNDDMIDQMALNELED